MKVLKAIWQFCSFLFWPQWGKKRKIHTIQLQELLQMPTEKVSQYYMKMASYAAEQCHGCSDSTKILAYKAYDVMIIAHKRGENPISQLNEFLGTKITEDVYLTILD